MFAPSNTNQDKSLFLTKSYFSYCIFLVLTETSHGMWTYANQLMFCFKAEAVLGYYALCAYMLEPSIDEYCIYRECECYFASSIKNWPLVCHSTIINYILRKVQILAKDSDLSATFHRYQV